MLGFLILLFVLVPLTDLTLLLVLSSYIGWKVSLALVIGSGILGAWLARLSYRGVIRKFTSNALQQGLSLELFTDGMMLTPGFLTDAFGFSLLVPQCRKWYRLRITSWIRKHNKIQIARFSSHEMEDEGVVDGEVQSRSDRQSSDRVTRIETYDSDG
jgi:UPF0716 protein FxsA